MKTLIDTLHARGPAPDCADKLALYAFLIGDWEADAIMHPETCGQRTLRGEVHAGWTLDGRAIQDVWILPGVFYGTTLRIYDAAIDAWRIHWLDPVMQSYPRMIGRVQGLDIVQLGENAAGDMIRWSFTKIGSNSFHWLAHVSRDQGASWRLQLEFLAHR